MAAERPIDAVTFDFWDTLVRTSGSDTRAARAAAITDVLDGHTLVVDADAIELAFEHAWSVHHAGWLDNRQVTAVDAANLVIDHLALDVVPEVRAELIEAFVHGAADVEAELAPHIEETLVALKEREVRLAIICDVGLTPSVVLRGYLAGHDVLDLFDHWSFSDQVGCYKPDRRIFEHALAGLGGIAPSRAAHVGDLRRTDVAGSQALGMTAIRYRGITDDPAGDGLPEGDRVIADHRELFAALALD